MNLGLLFLMIMIDDLLFTSMLKIMSQGFKLQNETQEF